MEKIKSFKGVLEDFLYGHHLRGEPRVLQFPPIYNSKYYPQAKPNERKKSISVVIPAYNEEARIGKTLKKVHEYIKRRNYEIIVVDDGSTDSTAEIVTNKFFPRLVQNFINKGKGYSVKRGVKAAAKDLILVSDSDLSTPIQMLDRLLPYIGEYDIVIGSRRMEGSDIKESQSLLRVLSGKVFSFIARSFFVLNVHDTQCGFKLFRREAAQDIFKRQKIDGFCFDVETLYLANRLGYKVKEVPVVWIDDKDSKVHIFRDSWRMFWDLMKIKRLYG